METIEEDAFEELIFRLFFIALVQGVSILTANSKGNVLSEHLGKIANIWARSVIDVGPRQQAKVVGTNVITKGVSFRGDFCSISITNCDGLDVMTLAGDCRPNEEN